ncbi:MAG TPA: ATP-dependent helicase [Candidatus Limnocylindrales bacterium]|nr:ATP-dependent helicase [Candidatus Limnocylindrales bacterium]
MSDVRHRCRVPGHPAVVERLAKLQVDQRRAAMAPPGPVLCVAPAGSGKTTTLVARIAWLVDEGAEPETICAITFNKRAAEELRERVAAALAPLGEGLAERIRIRTFHALGLELLREAGESVELVDRDAVLRAVAPRSTVADRRRLDTVLSRFKLDLDVDPVAIEADPLAGPVAQTFAAYEAEIRRRGGLDFDDLVARSLRLLERDSGVASVWRGRCTHLLVDEAQDLDRAQLRLALLLAAPANRIFLVGDDDQSIYGWRLADVRRLLGLADSSLPNLTRVDLKTNYRCPGTVLDRAVRLVEHNTERFAKVIRARPDASGTLVLAPTAADDVDRAESVLRSWPVEGGTRAVLARTNRELVPVAVAALRVGVAFRAPELVLPVESERVDEVIAAARNVPARLPLLAVGEVRRTAGRRDPIAAAVLGWSAAFRTLDELAAAIESVRRRLAELRRDDAPLSLATAHGTKGLEFDHVAVIGLDEGRFPSARSVAEAVEPDRALEEERRLAYVAWTRARRSLTLVYDPGAPSQFLLEAFSREELAA